TEATAVAVAGPAAAHAAPPGPPVPATKAGAALRVGVSEPRETQLGVPWHRERPGPRTWRGCNPHRNKEVPGPARGQMGPGKTVRAGALPVGGARLCCSERVPSPPPAHLHVQGTKSLTTAQIPPSCSILTAKEQARGGPSGGET
uniref:Uncharacterized protein n=1 Tax=Marmota marmota marmota TaxID=9994 RepID=A0A8C5ZCX4_MARMA